MSEDGPSNRELLLKIARKIEDVEARLNHIERQLARDSGDIGLVMASVRALCAVRGLDDHVEALNRALSERFPSHADEWSEDRPTDPGPAPLTTPPDA